MGINNKDKLIGVKEAAQQCRRNPETVRRWIWSGKLPAEKLGNQYFIEKSALESFCRETRTVQYETKSRQQVIADLKQLRAQIRERIGRDFTQDEIQDAIGHEERDNEISGLR
jgi:excisionase family DNA binding protein